jgi:flagellar biosynthesis/type III secretory pathway protein FliH
MARTSTIKHKPAIDDAVTIEEAYFFLRTAMWDQEDFKGYVSLFEAKGYQAGYDDGYEYHKDTYDDEAAYERGYDKGYKDGTEEGWQEGYDTGYNEASRDEDYRR